MVFDEPPLPGKVMEESSDQAQCYTQLKTKTEPQLMRLDTNAKQRYVMDVFDCYFKEMNHLKSFFSVAW